MLREYRIYCGEETNKEQGGELSYVCKCVKVYVCAVSLILTWLLSCVYMTVYVCRRGERKEVNEKDTWRLNISVRIAQLSWLLFSFVWREGQEEGKWCTMRHKGKAVYEQKQGSVL